MAKLYIDGVVSSPLSTTKEVSGTNNLYLGKDSSGSRYGNQILDDIRIYNAAISGLQIRENYLAGLNKLLASNAISRGEYDQRLTEFNKLIAQD